jgi:hypothetical protein
MMRAVTFALLLAVAAGSASPGRTDNLFDFLDFKTASLFRIGAFAPFGKTLSENFGTRYPVGFEARARTRFGFGAWASAGVWWKSDRRDVSTFVPLTVGGFYSRRYLRGLLCPYAGAFVSRAFTQLYFPVGDSSVRARGAGTIAGLALGTEVPLSALACLVADVSFGFGGAGMTFDAPAAGMPAGRNFVSLSNFTASLGLSTGFGGLPLW